MDQDLQKKFEEQEKKLEAIHSSVEKTRKYFLAVLWFSIIVFILPLIGLIFVIPVFLNTFSGLI
jgi:type II secretory pathway component PulF